VGYCGSSFAVVELEDQRVLEELETVFWVRSTSLLSCKTSGRSYRSELMIPRNLESQPGETKYQRSMPVAAVAKAVKATYHSHTAVAE